MNYAYLSSFWGPPPTNLQKHLNSHVRRLLDPNVEANAPVTPSTHFDLVRARFNPFRDIKKLRFVSSPVNVPDLESREAYFRANLKEEGMKAAFDFAARERADKRWFEEVEQFSEMLSDVLCCELTRFLEPEMDSGKR